MHLENDTDEERLMADLAMAIHLNSKKLPKRKRHVLIEHDAYRCLAKAV